MKHTNDGSAAAPRLLTYANEWALLELPRRPAAETWTFEQCIERVAAAGYDGCQASPAKAGVVRAAGLRFCTSGRINTPGEADAAVAGAADSGADCITVHAGWGMETDAEADAIAAAILAAEAKYAVPVYVETHRATMIQDPFRTLRLLERFSELGINGDFSHYYCGQEMVYQGFDVTRRALEPVLRRVGFIHGRISDGECMQCDITEPRNAVHVQNCVRLWTDSLRHWLARAAAGDVFIFCPELGPPASAYSIQVRDAAGQAVEVCDRWEQSLTLCTLAREAFAAAGGNTVAGNPATI